jgi:hypothetical protein
MKWAKVLSLAFVAAAALMACDGVSTASATVFCKATESPCSGANLIGEGSELKADAEGRSVFQTTLGLIFESCTGGTLAGTVSAPGGATEPVIIATAPSSFTWTGCEAGGVSATESGELETTYIEGTDHGTTTGKGFGIKFTRSGCTYVPLSAVAELGRVTGGVTPTIDINTVMTKSGGFACENTIVWKVTYKITRPAPFYVRAS